MIQMDIPNLSPLKTSNFLSMMDLLGLMNISLKLRVIDADRRHHDKGIELQVVCYIVHPVEADLLFPRVHILYEQEDSPP